MNYLLNVYSPRNINKNKMKKIVLGLLLVVTTISFAQEKVLLRLNYKKGDSYSTKTKLSQVMGAGLMTNNMDIHMDYSITNVTGEVYESEAKFVKYVMDMSQGGMQVSYDSTKSEEELDAAGKMMKTQMDPMLKSTLFIKGDKLGNIIETKAEPTFQGVENFTEQSSGVKYPKEAVSVGYSWNVSKDKDGMNFNFSYKVKEITAKNVVLDVSGKVSGIAEGDIKGEVNIDRESGLSLKSSISMAMKIQGQDLTTNVEITQVKN